MTAPRRRTAKAAVRPSEQAADRVLAQLREVAAALPDVVETVTYGHPSWKVGKRTFCVLEEYGGHLTVALKCDPLVARERVECEPGRFFATPYVGARGWVSLIVDRPVARAALHSLVAESHALVAPRAVKARR